jgi:HAD superfamily hydrolase (TIGR01509 family)
MTNTKAILFDLDGTIVNSKQAYKTALKTALAETKQETVNPKLAQEIPKRLEQGLPINDLIDEINCKKFLKTYLQAYYQATLTKTKPIPNIDKTLQKLSRKAKLALITMRHTPKQQVKAELEKHGLAKYFQHITTALDTSSPKPSPEALIQCAQQMAIPTSDCIVVGDSVADIKAGKNAGIKTVAVLSGLFSREELEKEKPDLILKNVTELPSFLEKILK